MNQGLDVLPIYISEIGNNSILNNKVSVSPVSNTFEGALSYPNKYRINLPRGHYTYIIETYDPIICNKDIINKVMESPEKDMFMDFELSIKVPYGAYHVFEPKFVLYVYGGFYQSVKMSCTVHPLREEYLDRWDYDTWLNSNSSTIKITGENKEKLEIFGIDKGIESPSVYESNKKIKEGCFYSVKLKDIRLEQNKYKYATCGIRLFNDGDSSISLCLSNKIQIVAIDDGIHGVKDEIDIDSDKIEGIGFAYKGNDLYEFWYLEKENFIWKYIGSQTIKHTDKTKFGIFVARTKGSVKVSDIAVIKY